LKEQNYGADWGDYVSFVKDMRAKAKAYDVDLLLVDTGVREIENAYRRKANGDLNRICMTAPGLVMQPHQMDLIATQYLR
jgi:hypothetical protein